jgi:inosose dehydratase
MTSHVTRREFLRAIGAAGAMAAANRGAAAVTPSDFGLRWGYHALTWQGQNTTALEEIAAGGFKGIQFPNTLYAQFADKPAEIRARLEHHGMQLVALSGSVVKLAPADERETIDRHVAEARLVKALGGLFLQVTDERPKDRQPTSADFERMGTLLSTIGRKVRDEGVQLTYHNHLRNLGERPEEVDAVLAAADPELLKLQLDIAHYSQAGGDPVAAIRKHHKRLAFLHMKDVKSPIPGKSDDKPMYSYDFVELGRGKVDIPGVVAALREAGFKGWAIIELDRVIDPVGSPAASLAINRKYVQDVLRLPL